MLRHPMHSLDQLHWRLRLRRRCHYRFLVHRTSTNQHHYHWHRLLIDIDLGPDHDLYLARAHVPVLSHVHAAHVLSGISRVLFLVHARDLSRAVALSRALVRVLVLSRADVPFPFRALFLVRVLAAVGVPSRAHVRAHVRAHDCDRDRRFSTRPLFLYSMRTTQPPPLLASPAPFLF